MRTLGRGKEVLMPVQRILAQPSSCATQPRPTDATSLKHPGEASLCTCMPQKCQCRATALPVRSPILSLDRNLSVPTSPERCATGDCARGWFASSARLDLKDVFWRATAAEWAHQEGKTEVEAYLHAQEVSTQRAGGK